MEFEEKNDDLNFDGMDDDYEYLMKMTELEMRRQTKTDRETAEKAAILSAQESEEYIKKIFRPVSYKDVENPSIFDTIYITPLPVYVAVGEIGGMKIGGACLIRAARMIRSSETGGEHVRSYVCYKPAMNTETKPVYVEILEYSYIPVRKGELMSKVQVRWLWPVVQIITAIDVVPGDAKGSTVFLIEYTSEETGQALKLPFEEFYKQTQEDLKNESRNGDALSFKIYMTENPDLTIDQLPIYVDYDQIKRKRAASSKEEPKRIEGCFSWFNSESDDKFQKWVLSAQKKGEDEGKKTEQTDELQEVAHMKLQSDVNSQFHGRFVWAPTDGARLPPVKGQQYAKFLDEDIEAQAALLAVE